MSENIYIIIGSWILIILAVERTIEIISDSKFFFPLRNWLARRTLSEDATRTASKLLFIFLHNIISCAWCLSVWVSMLFCWFLPGEYFCVAAAHNILVKWLALVGMTNLWHRIFQRAMTLGVYNGIIEVKHTLKMVGSDSDEDEMSELGIIIGDGGDGEYPESDE